MSLRIPFIALAVALATPLACWAQTSPEVWEGQILRGDAGMPMRLTLTLDGAEQRGALDLPNLIYAEEPVVVSPRADGALVVAMPFGLGDVPLVRNGARLTGEAEGARFVLTPGAPAPYTHEIITIPIEGGAYRGELYTPTDRQHTHGAVVIAGGAAASGEQLNWNTRSWCDFYARHGMHCLAYPRRRDVVDGEISDMVRDVADLRTVVHFLAARPNVDQNRVGIVAASRGVWLAVRAAAQDVAVKFLVLSGVPATTPSEQEVSSVVHRMRGAGRSDADIANAVAYLRLYFSVAHSGEGWDALAEAVTRVKQTPWAELVNRPTHLGDLDWYHVNGEFDPTRDYRRLRIPVYAYWGERDSIVPPAYHRALLESLMRDDPQLRTAVFPLGDHRGEQPGGDYGDGRFHWFGMADGLLDGITGWLAERGYSDPAPRARRR